MSLFSFSLYGSSGQATPVVTPTTPTSPKVVVNGAANPVIMKKAVSKSKLKAELAQYEIKLKWLTENLVPYLGFDSGGDMIQTAPWTKYRKTYYLIKVDGRNKNSQFAYAEDRNQWADRWPPYSSSAVNAVHSLANINKLKVEYKRKIATLKNEIAALSSPKPNTKTGSGTPKDAAPKPIVKKGPLVYNVSAVKDAYFSSERRDNLTLLGKDGNQTKGDILNPYLELWKSSTNHKGMISSWVNTTSTSTVSSKNFVGGANFKEDTNRYAFQFQYNPQPITLGYAGAPPVDIANFTSGQEEYALYTGGSGSGSISFDLIINRIDDMRYYGSDGALLPRADGLSPYPGRQPYGAKDTAKVKALFNEQEFIYNKGTMYDVEYLLRTVMGITMDSKFRGKTADFGWIGAMPIELHLGPGLRYWATLSAFTVNHVLFNERMVPIFSTVKVQCNRLPDYAVTGTKVNTSASIETTQGWTNITNPWDKKKGLS